MSSFAIPTPAFAEAMSIDTNATRKATPADAFNRAREIVHSGERLDMLALAAELGIARATLYRWTGDRERLLSDVMWTDVQALVRHVIDTTGGRGVKRIHATATTFLSILTGSGQLTTILNIEGETAFRLITDPRGGVRPRLVAMIAAEIQTEIDAGRYRPPEDPLLLAEGMVALGERFLYHGGDPDANPDPETASRIIALLIREPTT